MNWRLTPEEFDNFTPLNGYVVLDIAGTQHEEARGYVMTPTKQVEKLQNTIKDGVVVKLPPNPITPNAGFTYLSDKVDVEIGDKVKFHYLATGAQHEDNQKSGANLLLVEDRTYLLIPYSLLWIRTRKGKRTSLNGMVVGTPISENKMVVRLPISPATYYGKRVYTPRVGETVVFTHTPIPVEYETHSDENLFRFKGDGIVPYQDLLWGQMPVTSQRQGKNTKKSLMKKL